MVFFLSTLSILQMQYIYRPSKSKKWVTKEVKGMHAILQPSQHHLFFFFLLAFTCMATIMHSHDLFLFTWYFQKKLYFYFSQIPTQIQDHLAFDVPTYSSFWCESSQRRSNFVRNRKKMRFDLIF